MSTVLKQKKKTDEKIFRYICLIAAITGRELEDIKNEACEMCGVNPNIIKILKKGGNHGQRQE
ncbi:hypothetical protein V6948_08000 [Fusobacterium varium]|uniref:hypothetical protein n=1 Tax=Fusobacterium varium TaxID=856 RepID=UPI002FF3FE3F